MKDTKRKEAFLVITTLLRELDSINDMVQRYTHDEVTWDERIGEYIGNNWLKSVEELTTDTYERNLIYEMRRKFLAIHGYATITDASREQVHRPNEYLKDLAGFVSLAKDWGVTMDQIATITGEDPAYLKKSDSAWREYL